MLRKNSFSEQERNIIFNEIRKRKKEFLTTQTGKSAFKNISYIMIEVKK